MIFHKNHDRICFCTLALFLAFSDNTLAQNSEPELEEMTVIASRVAMPLRQVGASVSVLTTQELEQKSFPVLADVLRTLPGISVTQSGGLGKTTGVRIRGEDSYRTLLLIDGINVTDVSVVQAMPHFGHLLNSQFGRVEVLRGPQGMMYGADAGGVISITSKQSNQPLEGDLSAEVGQFDTRQLSGNVRGKVDQLRYSLTASHLATDGFNARITDPAADKDGYENTTLHGTSEFALTSNSGIGVVLRSTTGESQYDSWSAADFREEFEQRSGRVDWHYDSEQQSHELAYMRSTTDRTDIIANSEYEGRIEQWQYVGYYKAAEEVSFVFGADHRIDRYTSRAPWGNAEYERSQSGIFAESQVSFGDTFFYTIGLRYDDNEDFGEHTSYRFTAAYLLGKLKFRGSYGTGFRAPSLYQIDLNRGLAASYALPHLTEEKSEGYDLGVEWQFNKRSFMELVWFHNEIEDEIVWVSLGNFQGAYFQANGETESEGIEFSASVEVIDDLVLAGNYTYNDTTAGSSNTGAQPGDPRIRRPKHQYNASIRYKFWQDRINLGAFYRSSRDIVDYVYGVGRVPLDDYQVLGLNVAWEVSETLDTYLRWENALDEEYQEVIGYNTPGSAAYAGIRVHF